MLLARILAAEGQHKNFGSLPADVVQAAAKMGYLGGLELVVGVYKTAAACRVKEENVNVGETSLRLFTAFADANLALSQDETRPTFIRALLIHNAASSMAPWNGNRPEEQISLNLEARGLLESVGEADRDDDWLSVNAKASVGLIESDHVEFNEAEFRAIIDLMRRQRSKDHAGRCHYLASWLNEHERMLEAIALLEDVRDNDDFSADNQRERALALLERLDGDLRHQRKNKDVLGDPDV